MNYLTQDSWNWIVAIYLFLGGMGAMVMAISVIIHRFKVMGLENTKLMVWGNFVGLGMLAFGSLMLFYHLLDHLAVWHVLFGVFVKPDAWIAWGTWSIIIGMLAGWMYMLPHFRIPFIGWCRLYQWAIKMGEKFQGFWGWTTIVMSVFTAVYTGLLLQSFPAVELWHNPGIPVLFTISATSTALATLLILQYVIVREDDHQLRHSFERLDLWLIGAEIIVVIAFFYYLLTGTSNGQASYELLWNDPVWIFGFLLIGLVIPFLLNLGLAMKKLPGGFAVTMLSAFSVLVGGYILRHYMLLAGVYELPYPS